MRRVGSRCHRRRSRVSLSRPGVDGLTGCRDEPERRRLLSRARRSCVGRRSFWLALDALALGVAALAGARWARLRRRGGHIQWAEPHGTVRAGTLAARTLGEAGPPVVLLHGLAGSGRYWGAAYDRLADRSRLVVPDLLGFGASPRPPWGYSPQDHADALAACLAEVGAEGSALVVGHSLGSLVALAFAARHPERVAGVVAIAPPLYRDRVVAARRVARLGLFERLLGSPGPISAAACRWMCTHRERAARLAELWRPDLPSAVARDAVQHSWVSYSQTFRQLILAAGGVAWVDAIAVPVRFVAATADPVPDVELLMELASSRPHVSFAHWPGVDHDLPLTDPERCLEEILAALDAVAGTASADADVDF